MPKVERLSCAATKNMARSVKLSFGLTLSAMLAWVQGRQAPLILNRQVQKAPGRAHTFVRTYKCAMALHIDGGYHHLSAKTTDSLQMSRLLCCNSSGLSKHPLQHTALMQGFFVVKISNSNYCRFKPTVCV